MNNFLLQIYAIQNKINLGGEFGYDGKDISRDIQLICISAQGPRTGSTSAALCTSLTAGFSLIEKLVPGDKIVMPIRWECEKYAVTTDKAVGCYLGASGSDIRAACELNEGEFHSVIDFPVNDCWDAGRFIAGETLKIAVGGGSGANLYIRQKVYAIMMDAPV